MVTRCLGSRPRRDLGTIPDLGLIQDLGPSDSKTQGLDPNSSIPFNTSELWSLPSAYTEIENGVHSGGPCYPTITVRTQCREATTNRLRPDAETLERWRPDDDG